MSPSVTDEVLLNHCRQANTFFRGAFLEAHLYCADTFIAVSRPEGTVKTVTCGTDKSVPYNAVFGADQTGTCGTGKPVPYEGAV